MTLVLASTSVTRRAMLTAAGIAHEAVSPAVDEQAMKAALAPDARTIADALAEMKAVKVSRARPGDLVLGCDQTLALDDGTMFDKPADAQALREQLGRLSGRTHRLFSACVAAEAGRPVWRAVEVVKLTVRPLTTSFIDTYVEAAGSDLLGCVGGYQIEGRGAQLFERIEGSHFALLGLPLLPLLSWLRTRGIVAT